MGGAPPPPLDAAPQAPKNRRNSAPLGPGFGRFGGAEDHVEMGGVAGAPAHYHVGVVMVVPRRRRGPPTSPRPALGHGPGNPGWRRSEPTARICPSSDVRLGRWYAWGASEMSWAQPCIWHALGADCRRAIRVPSIDFGANSRGLGRWTAPQLVARIARNICLGLVDIPQTNA